MLPVVVFKGGVPSHRRRGWLVGVAAVDGVIQAMTWCDLGDVCVLVEQTIFFSLPHTLFFFPRCSCIYIFVDDTIFVYVCMFVT